MDHAEVHGIDPFSCTVSTWAAIGMVVTVIAVHPARSRSGMSKVGSPPAGWCQAKRNPNRSMVGYAGRRTA
jgi:hypothetical protein